MKKLILRRAGALVLALALMMTLTVVPAWAGDDDDEGDGSGTSTTVYVTEIDLDNSSLSLTVGGSSRTLTAAVYPANATYKTVTWSSSDDDVVTVAKGEEERNTTTATVTPQGVGTATITARATGSEKGGILATCEVTVKPVSITGVTLSQYSLELTVGDSRELTATVSPEKADQTVSWTTTSSTVATVNQSGMVTAVGPGTATIRASAGDKTAECTVTVKTDPVNSVTLEDSQGKTHSEGDPLKLVVGNSEKLTVTVLPSSATQSVKWKSDNTSVATVSDGVVTAVGGGTTTITVTTDGKDKDDNPMTATCTVTVTVPVTGVELNKSTLTLEVGKNELLTATVKPNNADNKGFSWSSSNTSIAAVNTNGRVEARGEGTAIITVTTADGGKTATCTVTVTPKPVPVESVSLDPAKLDLYVGGTATLEPKFTPENATNRNVTWSSSNTDAATVSIDGTVKAVGEGNAIITATSAEDNTKKAECQVTVSTVAVDSVTLDKTELKMAVNGTEVLKATVAPDNATDKTVTWESDNTAVATVSNGTVTAKTIGTATITAKAGGHEAKCTVTVTNPVTSVTLDKTSFSLQVGESVTLEATVEPDDADNFEKVEWSSSDESVATVDDNGKVTGVKKSDSRVAITAKAGNLSASCWVTVTPLPVPGISISGNSSITIDPGTQSFTATLSNVDADKVATEEGKIQWTVSFKSDQKQTVLPEPASGTGKTFTIDSRTTGPGEFIVKAAYTYTDDTGKSVTTDAIKSVTISGLALSGPNLEFDQATGAYKMLVGDSKVLIMTPYGAADDRGSTRALWSSSDSAVVSVIEDGGNLNAWALGSVVIKVTKGNYSAQCTVNVVEDTSVIITKDDGGKALTAAASEPLTLDKVYAELNKLCLLKTEDYGLDYITNLKVSNDEGTLYYNYSTEADTGNGVGYTDQFALTAGGGKLSLDRLYFVPKPGFSGTAEITFSALTQNRQNIAGIIRVDVTGSSGKTNLISYGARTGDPVWFLADDFSAFCKSVSGRDFNYVVFTMPKASDGVLYYNYMGGSGNPVTTSIRFTPSGTYTLDSVCFVPSTALGNNSKVYIGFRAVDTAGETISGEVEVTVTQSGAANDTANVHLIGERGRPVALQSELFNAACKNTIANDTLSFVTFKLPNPTEGTLYYNYRSDGTYDSRVTEGTRYYYSGSPGLNNVTFVPATGAAGQVAISYTGYGTGGASFNGTLYVSMGDVDRTIIYYSVAKGGSVTFNASDFYNAGIYQTGSGVNHVIFTDLPSTNLGTLYHNYRGSGYNNAQVNSSTRYYYSASSSQRLGLISFRAGDAVGTYTIRYEAYQSANDREPSFTGQVVIQVGSLAPNDVNLFCNTGGQARLTAAAVSSVCDAVMNNSLSYIEITSLPGTKEGRLYFDYNGFGTGTAVKVGDRAFYAGLPSIGQIVFVPFARFTGQAEITYIGYSADGQEQVSGRIVVNVTRSTYSHFDDMKDFAWAIDSVGYLYNAGAVIGTGGNCFTPGGIVTRADFALMLVRAYGLTATGSATFNDVSSGKYYADAVRIAYLRGIVSGYNGNFYPESPLTRQDAMVMLYNVLKVSGQTSTNGLAADLSVYHDEGQIATYAREVMGNLVQMGIVEGDGGYLRPQRQLTRAEAAILLHAIMTL